MTSLPDITPEAAPVPVPAADAETGKNLDAACATLAAELGRTDAKASLLLAFDGFVAGALLTAADKNLPTGVKVLGGTAVLALAAAAVLMLLVVRPRLRGDDRASFPHWARLDEAAIRTGMSGDTRPAQIKALSCLAVRKFRLLRHAVDLVLVALALLLAAAVALAL
ncbi:hypothetical protein ACVW0K_007227 [Streptomyces filamentosus]